MLTVIYVIWIAVWIAGSGRLEALLPQKQPSTIRMAAFGLNLVGDKASEHYPNIFLACFCSLWSRSSPKTAI